MASPAGPLPHPPTPPADPPSASAATANAASSRPQPTPTAPQAAATFSTTQPQTSTSDTGNAKRPRDARLIHMLLASLGVTAYQERVPLQLMDFSYRYTSSILQDALYLSAEGYTGLAPDGTVTHGGGVHGRGGAISDLSTINISALRLAIGSRMHYQFQPGLPKEVLQEVALERNAVRLPGQGAGLPRAPGPEVSGVRLPIEKFVLSGRGWGIKDSWESEGEEDVGEGAGEGGADGQDAGDGMEGIEGEGADENMDDLFEPYGGDDDDRDGEEGDREMGDD